MYEWKISIKYIFVYGSVTIITVLFSIISIISVSVLGNNFKNEVSASEMVAERVELASEYRMYPLFGLFPSTNGQTIFKFYDENGKDIVTTKEIAIKYISLNYKFNQFSTVGMIVSSIVLFIDLMIWIICLFQRQNCIFVAIGFLGVLSQLLSCLGFDSIYYIVGTIFAVISLVILFVYNYRKVNAENYKIMHRKELYE